MFKWISDFEENLLAECNTVNGSQMIHPSSMQSNNQACNRVYKMACGQSINNRLGELKTKQMFQIVAKNEFECKIFDDDRH